MKKIQQLNITLASLLVVPVAYAANTDSETVDLTATVASTCLIDAGGFSDINFSSQIDGTTALLTPGAMTVTADAYCNDNTTTVKIKSLNGGLFLATPPAIAASSDFAGVVDGTGRGLPYTIGGDWKGVALTTFDSNAQADNTDATVLTTNAINGTISLDVTLDSQTHPVLAGIYSDTITITITTAP
jgi:spore coat protein U-like protein